MTKRSLIRQRKLAEKAILEANKDFYNAFIEKNYPKKKQKIRPVLITIGSALAVTLTLVLCLVFLLPGDDSGPDPTPGKNYLAENEKAIESNLAELNAALQGISFEFGAKYSTQVNRRYDSESNDTLFYTIEILGQETNETTTITVYTNQDYLNRKTLRKEYENSVIGVFTLKYVKEVEDEIFITFTGETEYNGIVIFIEYAEISLEEESNFFHFFEQTIKKT